MRSEDSFLAAVQDFHRVWQRHVGAHERSHELALAPAELNALVEIGHAVDGRSGPQLVERLRIDKSQLARALRKLRQLDLVKTEVYSRDARLKVHRLTTVGKAVLEGVEQRAGKGVAAALHSIFEGDRHRMVEAMREVVTILEFREPWKPVVIREARAGDFGWVVERHGHVYHAEYGYDETFEAFVASEVAAFIGKRKRDRSAAFIAERAGARVGSAFVAEQSPRVARLRFVLVDPAARGSGVGARLLDHAIAFARGAGYARLELSTHGILKPAIALYRSRGFRKWGESAHPGYGFALRAQEWALDLRAPAR